MQLFHARQQPQGIRHPDRGITITTQQKFMDPDAAVAAALLLMDRQPIGQHATPGGQAVQQLSSNQSMAHGKGFVSFDNLEHAGVAGKRQVLHYGWACAWMQCIGSLTEQIVRDHSASITLDSSASQKMRFEDCHTPF
jgi:hypothetical protein